ncbi:MAG: hypothetical protein M3490_02435, partial [Chloroflexota bacterium]|nr:hypothetical protein [Chloroflexota bacterium]
STGRPGRGEREVHRRAANPLSGGRQRMTIPATGHIVPNGNGQDIVIERTFRAPIGDVWASVVDPKRMNRYIGT